MDTKDRTPSSKKGEGHLRTSLEKSETVRFISVQGYRGYRCNSGVSDSLSSSTEATGDPGLLYQEFLSIERFLVQHGDGPSAFPLG